ncbi:MAG: anhydro-N-acetylmuramic acid kinase [Proteobacteria bacterium]|nr:anhydro-N-acetylmuramic acid kinase [Pseudomonadota bacterium]
MTTLRNAPPRAVDLYIGLMSGTSLDGVDGVLLELARSPEATQELRYPSASDLRVRAHAHQVFPGQLRADLLVLTQSSPDEIHRAQRAAIELVDVYAQVVTKLLSQEALVATAVRAIGAHGQTVRHRPDRGYSVQINAPALLVERTGIAVVADFRSRDIAAGGQGAPLVPAFHHAAFWQPGEALAVLNLGGIANLTLIDQAGRTVGFDCGPANTLLDGWVQKHLGGEFDAGGTWAAGGGVSAALLHDLLAEPYFAALPPKSTGQELFNLAWLQRALASHAALEPQDVQATLAALTATTVAQDLRRHLPQARTLLVCGGGSENADLMQRLRRLLPGVDVVSSAARGMPPQQVEAAAFAWLAAQTLAGLPGNIPAVTGAAGPRVLGAVYAA